MKKGIFILIFVLVILSSSVYAFSLKDFLNIFSSPAPTIINASVYPQKVRPGDVMLTSVSVEDYFGVKDAVAQIGHEGGFDSVKLNLVDGTKYKGTYSGSWIVHNTKNLQWYNTTIIVTNERGSQAATIVSWQDPTVSHAASSITAGNFGGGNFSFNNSNLFIDATNNYVGIGTTSPTALLTIGSTNANPTFGIASVKQFFTASGAIAWDYANGQAASRRWGMRNDDIVYGDFSILTESSQNGGLNTRMLYIDPSGNVGIGTTIPSTKLHINVTNSTGGRLGDMVDALRITNTSGQEYFFINGTTGKVGIGTATPIGKLHVNSSASGQTSAHANANDLIVEDTTAAGISLLTNNSGLGSFVWGDAADALVSAIEYDHSTNKMNFYVNNINAMLIDNAGNVGIGTTNPSTKLEVAGTVNASMFQTLAGATTVNYQTWTNLTVITPQNGAWILNAWIAGSNGNPTADIQFQVSSASATNRVMRQSNGVSLSLRLDTTDGVNTAVQAYQEYSGAPQGVVWSLVKIG